MRKILVLFMLLLLFGCGGQSKEDMLHEGNALRDQGNYRGAIVLYKNALEKDANFLEARTELAAAYQAIGDFDKSENEFKKVMTQNPNASQILLKLAEVYIEEKKPEQALLELEKYHASHPETAESLTLYGRAHESTGDLDSAERLFKKALQLDSNAVQPGFYLAKVYIRRNNFDQARQILSEILKENKKFKPAYYLLAGLETQAGHPNEALKIYQSLIKVEPKELSALQMIGLLQIDLGDFAAAQNTVDNLLSTFNNRPEGSRLKGLLLFRQKKYSEAITSLETSLKLQQHPLTYYFLGLSYYNTGQLELALNQFQKALDLNPGFIRARILVSMTLLKQKRIDDAITEIQKVLRSDKDNAFAHNVLGSAYLAKGQYDEGMTELKKATELDPGLVDAYTKRGLFHLSKGETSQGEADLEKAVEVRPEVLNNRLMLVTLYLRQKNYSAAIETLQAGMDGSPSDALLYNYLAATYISQQKPELALKALLKAKEINPDYFTPYFNIASYYVSKAEYSKAILEYKSVLKRDPKNIKALFGLASIYALQGDNAGQAKIYQQLEATGSENGFAASVIYRIKQNDFSQALLIVNRGLDINKNSAGLLELKGDILINLKRLDEAESTFIRLVGISPERGNQLLVQFYIHNNNNGKAKRLIDELLKTDSDKDYPYLLASGFYMQEKQIQNAIDILKNGMTHVSDKLRIKMQLASIYITTGDKDRAEQILQRIIEETPDFSPAYSSLAGIAEVKGNKEKALELYRSALEYDRNNIAALNNLAYLLTDNFGKEKEALDLAMTAYRKQPNDPRIMDTLGYVLLKNNRSKDALNLLTKANELLPNMPTVKLHLAIAKYQEGDKINAKKLLQEVLITGTPEDIKQAKNILNSL